MRYTTFEPTKELQDLVRFWWALDSSAEGTAPHRLMAETCPNIIVVRQGSFTEADGHLAPDIHLAGPLSRTFDMVAHGPYSLFGIYLWPWAVRQLFQCNPDELMNRFTALGELLPGQNSLHHWPGLETDAWIADATRSLLAARSGCLRDERMENSIRSMVQDGGNTTVERFASSCGLARRQFERRFKTSTGFPPALFQRITRFQRTYRLIENGTARSLTEVALEAGYFDQSHFIRDFKRFSGMEPKNYFRHASEKVDNFVQLP